MTDATLLTDGARPAVRLERHLPDPPAVVWRALTEREQLRSWFPCDLILDGGRWEVGATITFPFPPEVMDMTLTGEVVQKVDVAPQYFGEGIVNWKSHLVSLTWKSQVGFVYDLNALKMQRRFSYKGHRAAGKERYVV